MNRSASTIYRHIWFKIFLQITWQFMKTWHKVNGYAMAFFYLVVILCMQPIFYFPWTSYIVLYSDSTLQYNHGTTDSRLHIYPLCGIFYFPWTSYIVTVSSNTIMAQQIAGYTFTPCVGSFISPWTSYIVTVPSNTIMAQQIAGYTFTPVWDLLFPLDVLYSLI